MSGEIRCKECGRIHQTPWWREEKSNRRVDIKAILKDAKLKAELIADAVRTSRFFK